MTQQMIDRAVCGEHGEPLSLAPGDDSLLACASYIAGRAAGLSAWGALERGGCLLWGDDLDLDPGSVLVVTDGAVYVRTEQ